MREGLKNCLKGNPRENVLFVSMLGSLTSCYKRMGHQFVHGTPIEDQVYALLKEREWFVKDTLALIYNVLCCLVGLLMR